MTAALPYFAFLARRWTPVLGPEGRFASKAAGMAAVEAKGGVGFVVDLVHGLAWRRKDGSWLELPRSGPTYQGGPEGDVLVWAWRDSAAAAGSDFAVGRFADFAAAADRLAGQLAGCTLFAFETATGEVRRRGRALPVWGAQHPPRRQAAAAGQTVLALDPASGNRDGDPT